MTISAPTFQRLQDGIQRVDDLRVRGPINAALAWLSGDLVTQLNTHFDAVSNSISSALATLLATANTWTAAQTIETAAGGNLLVVSTTDAGASGSTLVIRQQSASPAVNDVPARILFNGKDSGGADETYAATSVIITDPSAASEDADMRWFVMTNGVLATQLRLGGGVQVGTPTGGGQGTGTLNVDNAIYKDGTQVVSDRVTGYGDPFGALSRATFSTTTVTTAVLAQFVKALYTDLKAHGLIGN